GFPWDFHGFYQKKVRGRWIEAPRLTTDRQIADKNRVLKFLEALFERWRAQEIRSLGRHAVELSGECDDCGRVILRRVPATRSRWVGDGSPVRFPCFH